MMHKNGDVRPKSRPVKNWPDSKIRPEPARKFWVLNTIFSTRTQNKPNPKNPQISWLNPNPPTWPEHYIFSFLFLSNLSLLTIMVSHFYWLFWKTLHNYCIYFKLYNKNLIFSSPFSKNKPVHTF